MIRPRKIINRKPQGFSLIELLLAIFILGIGIISIAALLPAGIRQQQRAADDLIGPIVANNAMTLLRSKLKPDDFGYCEVFDPINWSPDLCDFNVGTPSGNSNNWRTICGDWMWRRPAFIPSGFGDASNPVDVTLRGAIDIFGYPDSDHIAEQWASATDIPGIPYNKEKYPNEIDDSGNPLADRPPVIRITASERQYPMWDGDPRADTLEAYDPTSRDGGKYFWDCMFRRYEQRILVAIFVYRIIDSNETGPYLVDTTNWQTPQLPFYRSLIGSSTGAWDATTNVLAGTEADNPNEPDNHWQGVGQWMIDQNGHIHRVQRGRRKLSDEEVKLVSSPATVMVSPSVYSPSFAAPTNVNWWEGASQNPPIIPSSTGGMVEEGVVTDIWYLPTSDSLNRAIVPVFATVEEL